MNQAIRNFSVSTGGGGGSMIAGGAALFATSGITYLMYSGHKQKMMMMQNPDMQKQVFHPEV